MKLPRQFNLAIMSWVNILCFSEILLPSCRYEDGPAISFRTVRNRLSAYWMVTDFRINNIDCTAVYKEKCNCEWRFLYEKTTYVGRLFNCKPNIESIDFDYSIEDNKKDLKIHFGKAWTDTYPHSYIGINYFGPIRTSFITYWEIVRLKNDELKLRAIYESDIYEISMEKTKDDP